MRPFTKFTKGPILLLSSADQAAVWKFMCPECNIPLTLGADPFDISRQSLYRCSACQKGGIGSCTNCGRVYHFSGRVTSCEGTMYRSAEASFWSDCVQCYPCQVGEHLHCLQSWIEGQSASHQEMVLRCLCKSCNHDPGVEDEFLYSPMGEGEG